MATLWQWKRCAVPIRVHAWVTPATGERAATQQSTQLKGCYVSVRKPTDFPNTLRYDESWFYATQINYSYLSKYLKTELICGSNPWIPTLNSDSISKLEVRLIQLESLKTWLVTSRNNLYIINGHFHLRTNLWIAVKVIHNFAHIWLHC